MKVQPDCHGLCRSMETHFRMCKHHTPDSSAQEAREAYLAGTRKKGQEETRKQAALRAKEQAARLEKAKPAE